MHNSVQHNSEQQEIIAALREAIRQGDWIVAQAQAERLAAQPPPRSAEELKLRAAALNELLDAARISHAHLATRLSQVTAAKRFRQSPGAERQNLVDPIRI